MCRSFARITVTLGMVVMAVMGLIMYMFAPELMALLTPLDEIRQLGITCLRIEAWAEPMFAASIVTYCVCVGAGDTLRPMLLNLLSMWCVRLSLAALLAPQYGLGGHGHRTNIPWHHVPHSSVAWPMDGSWHGTCHDKEQIKTMIC